MKQVRFRGFTHAETQLVEFLAKVESFPTTTVPVADLFRLVRNVDFPATSSSPTCSGAPKPTSASPLSLRPPRSPRPLLGRRPGHRRPDHGPSCSVAAVTQGLVKVENFAARPWQRPGFARLETTGPSPSSPEMSAAARSAGSTRWATSREGGKRLVTVNFYSPPLSKIQTFDRGTGAIGRGFIRRCSRRCDRRTQFDGGQERLNCEL